MDEIEKKYRAHPTVARFHVSNAFHKGIRGPRGSGKSTGCVTELFRRANEQEPAPDHIQWSRWAIVRNTYRELLDTTVKTWLRWFPESYLGPFNYSTMTHHIKWQGFDAEFLFRALDRPSDVKKTLSLELTGAYINEAKEVPFGIIAGLADAVGRFPERAPLQGFAGPTYKGIIMDTNAPDDDHWWFKLEEAFSQGKLDPRVWSFFVQPGGLIERNEKFYPNPKAENLEYIGQDYYTTRMVGKTKAHCRVYYCNQFGFVSDGKPVHPEYVDAVHGATEPLKPIPGLPIYVGIDFGLTPAALMGQIIPNGRWHVLNELVTERFGAKQFARELKPMLAREFKGFDLVIGGDPAGSSEAETDQQTCFQILNAEGIPAEPAYHNNDTTIRRGALSEPLSRLIDGKPGMIVSPLCKVFRKGMAGGFCYRKKQIAGSDQYHATPEKNKYSHVCEAGEYMALVGGEGVRLVESKTEQEQQAKNAHYNHYSDLIGSNSYSQGWMGR